MVALEDHGIRSLTSPSFSPDHHQVSERKLKVILFCLTIRAVEYLYTRLVAAPSASQEQSDNPYDFSSIRRLDASQVATYTGEKPNEEKKRILDSLKKQDSAFVVIASVSLEAGVRNFNSLLSHRHFGMEDAKLIMHAGRHLRAGHGHPLGPSRREEPLRSGERPRRFAHYLDFLGNSLGRGRGGIVVFFPRGADKPEGIYIQRPQALFGPIVSQGICFLSSLAIEGDPEAAYFDPMDAVLLEKHLKCLNAEIGLIQMKEGLIRTYVSSSSFREYVALRIQTHH